MKFLRTIRLDESDVQVYERAAEPGEWAVPGTFAFLYTESEKMSGGTLQAFKHGFLGTSSFGWSTLVEIAEITEDEFQGVVDRLAAHLMSDYGAPHIAAALPVAGDEADYAATICEHQLHTLLAIERQFGDEGIEESLKVIRPNAASHEGLKIWGVEED